MGKHLSAAAIAAIMALGFLPTTGSLHVSKAHAAVLQDDEEDRRRSRQNLARNTALTLGEVVNHMNAEPPELQTALSKLNRLLERDLAPFDLSTALEIRGGVYAALDTDDEAIQRQNYQAALRDYVRVLEIDALPLDRLKQIRNNVAQLYFVTENYPQAIRFMREYLADPANAEDSNAWYILAAAYASLEPKDYRSARQPAERALQFDEKKEKKSYDLLNLIYSELELLPQRQRLLEEVIQRYPGDQSYWVQLYGIYTVNGREKDGFLVLEAAYNSGLITKDSLIIAIAQSYSLLDNPFRGATLLEDEMANGRVDENLANLKLLSQLWSMSREHRKNIEVLTKAAPMADDGEIYYFLGQAYMADDQYTPAIQALNNALRRGGLSSRQRGDAHFLIGSAYFERDGDTPAGRRRARESWVRATEFSNVANSARGWIDYIDTIENVIRQQDEVERIQRMEARERQVTRCVDMIDLAEIGGVADANELQTCRTFVSRLDVDGDGELRDNEIEAFTETGRFPDEVPEETEEETEEDAG